MKLKEAWALVKDTAAEWWEDHAPRFSAALSFYTLLSLAPILLITLAIVGLVVGGEESAQTAIVDQARDMMGRTGADAVEGVLENAERPGAGIVSLVIGVVVLILGATGVFGQLQAALNQMWEVRPKPGQGLWGMIRNRLLSFTAVMAVGFVLLVSLAVSAALAALGDVMEDNLPFSGVVLQLLNLVVSLAIVTLMFALAFKILPDAKVQWSDVWIGAAGTALLFTVGKYLIGLYLGQSSTSSSYGAAGSLVVLLVWVYYSAQIFFLGAEFTQVYANRYGGGIVPDESAERIIETGKEARGGAGVAHEPGEEQRREERAPERRAA